MANPEDLEREISRLWARVSGPGGSPEPSFEPVVPASPGGTGELAWETMSILKRQHNRQSKTWAEMLEAKEQSLRIARERLAKAETDLAGLRARLDGEDKRVMAEVMDAQSRVQEAHRALQSERARFSADLQSMNELVEEARRAAAADAARFRTEEDRFHKREQQYLIDLAELQSLAARRQEEAGKSEDSAKLLQTGLKEAKNALEKTLAELLRERKIREESEAERAKALQKVSEVEKHFDELSRIWEEERGQWRELWDRERSTWESKRQELTAWEETLRREREAWTAQAAAAERDQARYAEQVSRSIRDSSESGAQLAGALKRLAALETPAAPSVSSRFKLGRREAFSLCGAAAAALLGWWLSAWTLKAGASQTIALESPTGMALSGGKVWLTDWSGRLTAFEPGDLRAPAATKVPAVPAPYRPAALAAAAGLLWTLDTAQARIVRHDAADPAKILAERPAPGPAPTALAHDGRHLWSYDAANRALYRHSEDEGTFKAYPLDDDAVPTAMAWSGGRLWLYDSKSRTLRVYEQAGEALTLAGRHDIGAPVAAIAAEPSGQLLVLAGPSSQRAGHAVIRYKHGRRLFTIF